MTRFLVPDAASLARGAAAFVVFAAITVLAVVFRVRADDGTFLHSHAPAQWLTADEPFSLQARMGDSVLELMFVLPPSHEPVSIDVWSTGENVGIREDGRLRPQFATGAGTREPWSFRLEPAREERRIAVGTIRRNGRAALAVATSLPGVASNPSWMARSPENSWAEAAVADGRGEPSLAREFASAPEALARRLPFHLVVFVGLLLAFGRFGLHTRPRFGEEVRWLTLAGFGVLAVHNLVNLPPRLGFDLTGHLEYIQRLAGGGGLPLPGDGWQMFQAPLYYLLSAGLAIPLEQWLSPDDCVRALRVIPMAAGLAQVELSFRASRAALPGRPDLQAVGTLVGGLLPMNLYMSQYVGNEPLAGAFTAAGLVAAVAVLARPERVHRPGFAWGAGVVLGLALLTKVSAVVVAPIVVAAFVAAAWRQVGARLAAVRVAQISLATGVVAGWFYVRNWVLVGEPFVGGWDASRGIVWWQDPGYRTWDQLLSFGRALVQPVYAATSGLWDALWSTLWADAFLGSSTVAHVTPWNMDFMVASPLLSIIPAVFIGIGVVAALDPRRWIDNGALLVAVCSLAAFLAAIIVLYLAVPIYSTAKATYTLGATPAYAILAAAGTSIAVGRRWGAAVTFAALGVWGVNSWLGYWVA